MSRRELKKTILAILAEDNLTTVQQKLADYRDKDILNPLFSALCSADARVRWHAVTAFGHVVPRIARQDMEAGRIIMRRLLWSLNDESGGIGWGAPEAMAESMLHYEPLAREYLHMLVSYIRQDGEEPFQEGNYIELPQLQQGVLWGIARLSPCFGQSLRTLGAATYLKHYLFAADGTVRGLAVWCLGLLGEKSLIRAIPQLAGDLWQVRLYRDGDFTDFTVAALVRQALDPINHI